MWRSKCAKIIAPSVEPTIWYLHGAANKSLLAQSYSQRKLSLLATHQCKKSLPSTSLNPRKLKSATCAANTSESA